MTDHDETCLCVRCKVMADFEAKLAARREAAPRGKRLGQSWSGRWWAVRHLFIWRWRLGYWDFGAAWAAWRFVR